jgi:hypothetical protein
MRISGTRIHAQVGRAIGGVAVVAATVAGCSSPSSTSSVATTAPAGAVTTAASGGTFCQQYFAVIASINGRSFTAEGFQQFKASFQSLANSAPAAIQSDVNSMNSVVQAASGVEGLPATSPAQTNVDAYVTANCAQSSTLTTAPK